MIVFNMWVCDRNRSIMFLVGEFLLDLGVDLGVRELCRHADGVLDGVGIRRSVADDTDPFEAQQRSAAVFGIVEFLLECGESLAAQQRPDLRCNG